MVRIAIAGCGHAARVHLGRLLALPDVRVVGCADTELSAAQSLAGRAPANHPSGPIPAFSDHREMLARAAADAVAIFTPHRAHYRPAMDALQAGCHVFIEKPLSTNVQEAADIVGLARGRNRLVGVGHQYRLRPSLMRARKLLRDGTIGKVRLITAVLAAPWLASHRGPEDSWRLDPKVSGGGILADAGDHLLDALLWATGQSAVEAAAFQSRSEPALDLVTAAAIRLADGSMATLGISGVASESLFELTFFGESVRLRLTEATLEIALGDQPGQVAALPEPTETIDGNFIEAVARGSPLCCPADQAMDTVRLIDAISRSAATGQVVRLA